jgi:hypothetical protein
LPNVGLYNLPLCSQVVRGLDVGQIVAQPGEHAGGFGEVDLLRVQQRSLGAH